MKKNIILIITLSLTFCLGFTVNSVISTINEDTQTDRVTGIGGIFFKCKDPQKVTEWYKEHLGLDTNPYGASFEWYETPDSTRKAETQWTPFPETTEYFGSSSQDFMINYRVKNLKSLVKELKEEGVTIVDKIETYDYGKFVHLLDIEGNRIQLWEPVY